MRTCAVLLVSMLPVVALAQDGKWPEVALFGRIVTVTHERVPAAEVWVSDAQHQVLARTVADGDGYYQLRRLPAGTLRLHARGADVVEGSIEVPATGFTRQATLMLEDGEPLSGSVEWPDGSPVAGADVLLVAEPRLPDPFDWWTETTTDAAGGWRLPAVPLRPLVVRVFVPGHLLAEQAVARGRSGPVKIVMPAGSTTERRVEVTGAPAGLPVVVRCEPTAVGGRPAMRLPRGAREATVGADGVATLWSLPVHHEVRVEVPGYRSIPVFVPCGASVAKAMQFALTPLPADLLEPSTIMHGQLIDELGKPVANETLVAMLDDRRGKPCVTAADGSFAIDLPARERVLCRVGLLSSSRHLAGERCQLGADGISWLTLPAEAKTRLRLHAMRAGTVRGTLLGPTGLPFAAAQVQLSSGVVGATDAGGRLYLPGLPVGPCELSATGPDGQTGKVAIEIDASEQTRPDKLVFAPAGEVHGVVTGAGGEPIASAALNLAIDDPRVQGNVRLAAQLRRALAMRVDTVRLLLTDRHGRFRLPALSEGDWNVIEWVAPSAGEAGAMEPFTVVAGASLQLELVIGR